MTAKVLVVGGGIVGSAVAWRLARAGLEVELLEGERPETATAASGGMLGYRSELAEPDPSLALGRASSELWRQWREELGGPAALGWAEQGTVWLLEAAGVEGFLATRRWQLEAGLPPPTFPETIPGLPALAAGLTPVAYPDEAAVHPPSVLRAFREAATRAGATLRIGEVQALLETGGRCRGVDLPEGKLEADAVVLAAGSWSRAVLGEDRALPVGAVRGQVATFALESSVVLRTESFYAVPRPGGELLVGATEEPVDLSAAGRPAPLELLQQVLEAARRTLPALEGREPTGLYSGLRPWSEDRQPLVGAAPAAFGLEGLFLATGHTRNGILQAPLTAEVIRAAVLDEPAPGGLDLAPWATDRFGPG